MESITSGAGKLLGSSGGQKVMGAVTPNDSVFPSLSWDTRLKGFIACTGLGNLLFNHVEGIVLQILSMVFMFMMNFTWFGVCSVLGMLMMLGS